jgi:multicomponent Na+:H+ antiporter subunit E
MWTPLDLLIRMAGYLLLWLVLMGGPEQLVFGTLTAAIAASWSLRLLPPGSLRLRPLRLLLIAPHFLWQSVRAGIDVAWRAFHPRLPLAPGFVVYRPQLQPGSALNLFTAYTSLLPGTVPCGDEDGEVIYHCLDMAQPNAAQLAAEEARLRAAIAPEATAGE